MSDTYADADADRIARVAAEAFEPVRRRPDFRRLQRTIDETLKFVAKNREIIELARKAAQVVAEAYRSRAHFQAKALRHLFEFIRTTRLAVKQKAALFVELAFRTLCGPRIRQSEIPRPPPVKVYERVRPTIELVTSSTRLVRGPNTTPQAEMQIPACGNTVLT